MAKVTSKYQVTIPKAIAERYGIQVGDDVEFVPAGDAIRLIPATVPRAPMSIATRLELFDAATERLQSLAREGREMSAPTERGWTREDLYQRGRTD